jgi:hypothetical protein
MPKGAASSTQSTIIIIARQFGQHFKQARLFAFAGGQARNGKAQQHGKDHHRKDLALRGGGHRIVGHQRHQLIGKGRRRRG